MGCKMHGIRYKRGTQVFSIVVVIHRTARNHACALPANIATRARVCCEKGLYEWSQDAIINVPGALSLARLQGLAGPPRVDRVRLLLEVRTSAGWS